MIRKIPRLVRLQAKFALTSSVATAVDYGLYLLFVERLAWKPVPANIASFSIAVLVNFTLQRYFVFRLQRRLPYAFLGAMLVSAGGLLLSTGLVWSLSRVPFLEPRQYLVKGLATGVVFFYNFFFKRFAFEKRFLSAD